MPWGRKTLVTSRSSASSAAQDQVRLAQQPGQAVGQQVNVAPVHPGAHPRAQRLLHAVQARDQGGEVGVLGRVAARDVARVAGKLGARVDEQRVALRRGALLQHLVVQHGTAGVERDDRVVGKLLLAQCARLKKCELDFKLRGAGAEGPCCGEVAERAQAIGLAQAQQRVEASSRRGHIIQPPA
jgi:hypothetical protein